MSKKLIKVPVGNSFDLKVGEAVVENTSQNINTQTVNVICRDIQKPEIIQNQEPLKQEFKDLKDEIIRVFKTIILEDRQASLNIIDKSGSVIILIKDLFSLISSLFEVDESKIKINLEDVDIGCFSKTLPIKKINSVKINKNNTFLDLQVVDNGKYNLLSDEYKISLNRVLVL
jgi:hypothetical protein